MPVQDADFEALPHTSTECALNQNQMKSNVKSFLKEVMMLYLPSLHECLHCAHIHEHTHDMRS